MAEIEITTPKIKTYNDFVKQLQEITKQDSDIVLSFYNTDSKIVIYEY